MIKTGLSPLEVESDRSYSLIDIRPVSERVSELGFIPGTLLWPLEDDLRAFAERIAHLSATKPVVLTCVSGRRSGLAIAALEPLLGPTRHLEGGLLAWSASGFPLCHPEEHAPPPGHFHVRFRSAFLAELVELSVTTDADIEPLACLEYVYDALDMNVPTGIAQRLEVPREVAWPLIDRAGAVLRDFGGECERIAAFMGPLYAMG